MVVHHRNWLTVANIPLHLQILVDTIPLVDRSRLRNKLTLRTHFTHHGVKTFNF